MTSWKRCLTSYGTRPATIPPQGITIPANYEEYLAQFEARNLADYVVAYQQAYAAMQAAN